MSTKSTSRDAPDAVDNSLALGGRLLIAVLFIPSGVAHVLGLSGTASMIASKGLPAPLLLAGATAFLEIGAAMCILAGWKVREAALALSVFTLVAAFLFHAFWSAPAAQAMVQQFAFFKNIGIAGGLLVLAALGPGEYRMGSRRK